MSKFSDLIKDVKNPRWTNELKTGIDIEVFFSNLGRYVPYHATSYDDAEHGRYLFEQASAGVYGEVAEALALTQKQITVRNERQKVRYHTAAEKVIKPLERAAKLGIATEEESATLTAWETYSVLLNRVDTTATNITWPPSPTV